MRLLIPINPDTDGQRKLWRAVLNQLAEDYLNDLPSANKMLDTPRGVRKLGRCTELGGFSLKFFVEGMRKAKVEYQDSGMDLSDWVAERIDLVREARRDRRKDSALGRDQDACLEKLCRDKRIRKIDPDLADYLKCNPKGYAGTTSAYIKHEMERDAKKSKEFFKEFWS